MVLIHYYYSYLRFDSQTPHQPFLCVRSSLSEDSVSADMPSDLQDRVNAQILSDRQPI
jgi:hypothetical protein